MEDRKIFGNVETDTFLRQDSRIPNLLIINTLKKEDISRCSVIKTALCSIPNIHVTLSLARIYLFARVNNLRNQKYLDAFGENLKRLRKAEEISQEKLARDTEVD